MSEQAVNAVFRNSKTSGTDRNIMLAIAWRCDENMTTANWNKPPTLQEIANMAGTGKRNLMKRIAVLVDAGELIYKTTGAGRGIRNEFTINLETVNFSAINGELPDNSENNGELWSSPIEEITVNSKVHQSEIDELKLMVNSLQETVNFLAEMVNSEAINGELASHTRKKKHSLKHFSKEKGEEEHAQAREEFPPHFSEFDILGPKSDQEQQYRQMQTAILEICNMTKSQRNREKSFDLAVTLVEGYPDMQPDWLGSKWLEYFKQHDWRGKRGELPTIAAMNDTIGAAWIGVAPTANGNGHAPPNVGITRGLNVPDKPIIGEF